MKKQLLLLMALVLTSSAMNAKADEKKPMRQSNLRIETEFLMAAMHDYTTAINTANRKAFDNALKTVLKSSDKQTVILPSEKKTILEAVLTPSEKQVVLDTALTQALKTNDLYTILELVGTDAKPIENREPLARPTKKERKKQAKQYGFDLTTYEQLLSDASVVMYSDIRPSNFRPQIDPSDKRRANFQKQIDAIAQMLVSDEKADRKKGQDQLHGIANQVRDKIKLMEMQE